MSVPSMRSKKHYYWQTGIARHPELDESRREYLGTLVVGSSSSDEPDWFDAANLIFGSKKSYTTEVFSTSKLEGISDRLKAQMPCINTDDRVIWLLKDDDTVK